MNSALDTDTDTPAIADAAANPAPADASATALADSQPPGPDSAEPTPAAVNYEQLQLPEHYHIDTQLLDDFKTALSAMNLNQQQAQQLADLGVKQAQLLAAQHDQQQQTGQAALMEAFNTEDGSVKSAEFQPPPFIRDQAEKWLRQAKADTELGGDGFAENLAVAAQAVKELASPQLKELFNKTGLGNHPELIRAFYKAGLLLAADKPVTAGAKPAPAGRTRHQQQALVLYG